MKIFNSLSLKLENKESIIGIIGMGYVGLPLALRYISVGFKVLGFDINQSKIDKLNSGESYLSHIPSEKIKEANKGGFSLTSDFSRSSECDILIICVPTPLSKHREPDLTYVVETLKSIKDHLRRGQLISLESTTYPGTTEEVVLPLAQRTDLEVGKDFFLVYSPEREDPGNLSFDTNTIPKIVGGHTKDCLDLGVKLYKYAIDNVVPVSSTKVAELTKLLENIYRAVNIGLVNEMKILADKMDIDLFEVIDAASTKPFGFNAFYPGPGLGGHCIPIDPFYLTWKAKEFDVNTKFIELSGEINKSMPQYVVNKTNLALNKFNKSISSSSILILGLAYKKNIEDTRGSPSVEIIELLSNLGAEVNYSDPFLPSFPDMKEHNFNMSSISLTPENIERFDALIIATDHDEFDYDLIFKESKLIIDCRGRYRGKYDKVFRA